MSSIQTEFTVTTGYRWPLRAISLLLFLQMLWLCGITAYFAQQIDWEQELADPMAVVAPLAVLLLVTAVGFFFRRRFAWHFAMTAQGIMLLGSLTIYFFTVSHLRDSHLLYLSMLYCILMVLYLNTSDVRMAFHVRYVKIDDVEEENEFTR